MEKFCFGMSSCAFRDFDEKHFCELKNAGVKVMELSSDFQEYIDNVDFSDVKEKADKYGIKLWSLHLPYAPFDKVNIANCDEEKRRYTVDYFKTVIDRGIKIGIKIYVVHPSAEPYKDEERDEALMCAKKSLKELASYADNFGAVIAVEDLPRTCLGRDTKEILDLLSADERLKVCFDTNHLLSDSIKAFIDAVGDRIITTHFSDFDFKNERHWLPGEGKIDWCELIDALDKKNYSGPILYEMSLVPPITGTIERRNLTFDDLSENHNCLINKKPLKAIGKIVEEKCIFWRDIK